MPGPRGSRNSSTRGSSPDRSRTSCRGRETPSGWSPTPARIEQDLPSRGGQVHLRSLLLTLSRTDPGGQTDGAAALGRTIDLLKRRGLLIVISDLYDERDLVERALMRAAHIGHEVVVFHVLSRDEVELPFRDDVELEDPETGRLVLSNGAAAVRPYREAISAFLERWRTRCATYGIDYVRVFTDAPLEAGAARLSAAPRGAEA